MRWCREKHDGGSRCATDLVQLTICTCFCRSTSSYRLLPEDAYHDTKRQTAYTYPICDHQHGEPWRGTAALGRWAQPPKLKRVMLRAIAAKMHNDSRVDSSGLIDLPITPEPHWCWGRSKCEIGGREECKRPRQRGLGTAAGATTGAVANHMARKLLRHLCGFIYHTIHWHRS